MQLFTKLYIHIIEQKVINNQLIEPRNNLIITFIAQYP